MYFMYLFLRHYVADEEHKLNWKELQVSDVGTLMVEPLRILDRRVRQLKNCLVDQIKVQWDKYSLGYATWEDVETLQRDYLSLFLPPREYVSQRWGVCDTTF
jgi:hypothetical protein